MKIVYGPFIRTLEEQLYFDEMVERLRKENPKRPATTTQAPSTQRTLERNELDDITYWSRPLPPPEKWKANPSAKTIEERVQPRPLDPREIELFERTRRRPKNSEGSSIKSSVTPLLRERAIEAFVYTPPARVTEAEVKARAVNLVEYKSEPLKEVWVELPWWKAIFHRLRGHKVKIDDE